MRIRFFVILFLITLQFSFANGNQELPTGITGVQKTQQARPNLPGDFIIDFGVSHFINAPDSMATSTLRSRAVNIYYLYRIPFGDNSNFSINPGIGIGLENYMFKDDNVTLEMNQDQTKLVGLTEFDGLKKSKLNLNYLDIPVELRYNANRDNPSKGLKVSVGGRVGILFDAKTKVKYELEDDVKIMKAKEDFSLNKIRYSLHGRIGLGNFSVFYYQNLNSVFKKDKGPEGTNETKSFMAGISFTLF